MRNNFEKLREFECCGYEIIQELFDYDSQKLRILPQNVTEQIYCPRCGDDEAFSVDDE